MTEATVLLSLPLRRVVLTDPVSRPPDWLEDEFRQLPALLAADRLAAAEAAVTVQSERELDLLRLQRQAWIQGLGELKRAVGQTDGKLASILDELREATVELAHVIATKLVFRQIASNSFPVDRLVAEVLGRLNTREAATVRLHPDDLAALTSDGMVSPDFGSDREVRLVPDAKLARGDCKAMAGEITVVYELKRQIEEIRRELLSTVSGHAEPGP